MNGEAVWLLYLLILLDFLLEQGSAHVAYHRKFREPSRSLPSVTLAAPIDRVPSILDSVKRLHPECGFLVGSDSGFFF